MELKQHCQKVLGIFWQPGLQIQRPRLYPRHRKMLQSFVSTSAMCSLANSSSFLLQNPSFPSNLLMFFMPRLPVLAGQLSIPCLTFLFWQHKLTDAVPIWHSMVHFISTQKPSSTSAHSSFLWTPVISSNQTEISSVGWSMALRTRLWSPYGPFT